MSPGQLRKSLRTKRRNISGKEREAASYKIARHLARYLPFRRCRKFATYLPLPEEVDTSPVIELARTLEKRIYLPVMNTNTWQNQPMVFGLYSPDITLLRENHFGIREPAVMPATCIPGNDIDFVCVPVVGFNEHCDRIGMGGGYYDRAFARPHYKRTRLVGLAFEAQLAEFEPAEHDVPMDAVITESRVIERAISATR